MSRFYHMWQAYRNRYYIQPGKAKFKSTVCASVVWILTLICSVFNAYTVFADLNPRNADGYSLTLSILNLLVWVYYTFAWIASSCIMLLMASFLAEEYQLINQDIQLMFRMGAHHLNRGIGHMRRRHWELSQIVGKVDDIFCAHMGLSVVASLLLSCFGLYLLIWRTAHGNTMLRVIQCTWFLAALNKLTCDCVSGIIGHDAVGDIKSVLFIHRLVYFNHCVLHNNKGAA